MSKKELQEIKEKMTLHEWETLAIQWACEIYPGREVESITNDSTLQVIPGVATEEIAQSFWGQEDDSIGVEIELEMSTQQLYSSLGVKKGQSLPGLMRAGYTKGHGRLVLDQPDISLRRAEQLQAHYAQRDGRQLSSGWTPQNPMWHQLCGVHRLIRHLGESRPQNGFCGGMLIADDVGLGKSLQVISFMLMVSYLIDCQLDGTEWPPVHSMCSLDLF